MGELAAEVIVVGGGPAGSAVAARLADLGRDVLLLDRARFPRRKPCGECVNPAGVAALGRLGVLEEVEAAGTTRLHGWRIAVEGGSSFSGRFPEGRWAMGVPRATLDSLLLRHARERGVRVREGVQVTGLLWEEGSVVGVEAREGNATESLRARIVIGADGLRSVVVRRASLLRRKPRLTKLALTAHVRGNLGLAGQGELHVLADGVVGMAEVGDGTANVTVVVSGGEGGEVAGDREGYFDHALRRLKGGAWERTDEVLATGPFDWPTRGAVRPGALLVGDSAGYYDPFTGQGVSRALRGAELAAPLVEEALRQRGSTRALRRYDRRRTRAFAPGMRLQHLIELFVSRPQWLNPAVGVLDRRPALADALIAVTGDLEPVRTLFHPRVLASLVLNR